MTKTIESDSRDWQDAAIATIATALNNVRKMVEKVERTGSNPHFNYNYVEEGTLLAQLRKYLIEEGLILTPEVSSDVQTFLETGNKKNMTLVVFVQSYRLAHTSGAVWPWPIQVVACGQDVNDKATWKASTGASKYALMRLLQLATGDDPEQDNGLDREPTQTSTFSSAPPRMPRSTTPRGGGRPNVEQVLANIDPDDLMSEHEGLAKDCGVYAAVFQASERVHGKKVCEANDSMKFSCMDQFLETKNIRSARQIRVGQIQELLDFTQTWGAPSDPTPLPAHEDDAIL